MFQYSLFISFCTEIQIGSDYADSTNLWSCFVCTLRQLPVSEYLKYKSLMNLMYFIAIKVLLLYYSISCLGYLNNVLPNLRSKLQ